MMTKKMQSIAKNIITQYLLESNAFIAVITGTFSSSASPALSASGLSETLSFVLNAVIMHTTTMIAQRMVIVTVNACCVKYVSALLENFVSMIVNTAFTNTLPRVWKICWICPRNPRSYEFLVISEIRE